MKPVRDWSIRARLLLAFAGVLLPYLALAGLGLAAFGILWHQVQALQKEVVVEMQGAADLQVALGQLVMPANDYLITGDPVERGEFERRLARARHLLARVDRAHAAHPEERRLLGEVAAQLEVVETLSRQILAVSRPASDPGLPGKMKTLDRLGDDLVAGLDRFREVSAREIDEGVERAVAMVWWLSAAGATLLVLSLGGGAVLALVFGAWLNRPIRALALGSRRIAEGDLAHRVAADVGGELGEAARAFNQMAIRLEASYATLKDLHQAARSLATEHDPATLLQQIVDAAWGLIGARYAALARFERGSSIGEFFTAGLAPDARQKMGSLPEGRGLLAPVFTGQTVRLDDLSIHPAAVGFPPGHPAMRSLLGAPIRFREEVLGALYLTEKPGGFTADDERLLATLCADAAVALKNALLYEEAETQRVRLAQVFASASDAIVSADSQGTIVTWNQGAERIFGYGAREAVGQSLTTFMPERYREAHRLGLDRAVATGATRVIGRTIEVYGVRKDGTEFPLELTISQWTARGETFFSGIMRDITERKQVEQMKSDFVSFATHQLRTPLAGIKWLLELAAEGKDIPEETMSYVQDARESAERLIELVNDLLNVSRLESGRLTVVPQPVRLEELTGGVLEELGALARDKQQALTVEGADTVPAVMVDPQLFRQVVLNLVSNAIKYTPASGRITIRMDRQGDHVRWEIRDSGIGIPRAAQARLFEKFFRAENAMTTVTEGTGLGLYLARLIVERSGGRLRCESEEGHGATFIITLPTPG